MELYQVVNELSNKAISPIIDTDNNGMAIVGFKNFIEKGDLEKIGITPDIVTLYHLGRLDDDSHTLEPVNIGCEVVCTGKNYQDKLDEFISSLKLNAEE